MTFGEFIKNERIGLNQTLRRFCEINGFDRANHSRLERGIVPAPGDDIELRALGQALGLQPGGYDWPTFVDLAAASQRSLPRQPSEQEILARLPLIPTRRIGRERLEALVAHVRQNS